MVSLACVANVGCSPSGVCGGDGALCISSEQCENTCLTSRVCGEGEGGDSDEPSGDRPTLGPGTAALLEDIELLTQLVQGSS